MRRKVIRLAGKTFVVSLPSPWVRQWGVKKGDELELIDVGPRLLVSTSKSRDLKTGVVDVSGSSERAIRWVLSSLHKKGYDEIEVRTADHEQVCLIDGLLKDLFIGFVMVHQSETRCVIRSLSREIDDQFDSILRRAFLITLDMGEELLKALQDGKYDRLAAISLAEKANNQLTNFCERVLNKRGHSDPLKTNFLYVIVWNLEKIADDYKYICEHLQQKGKVAKETLGLLNDVNGLLREYYGLFYGFDLGRLSGLAEKFRVMSDKIEKAMLKSPDSVVLSHLWHIVLKTADFSASTFALNEK